jgi:hypothetical protein
MVDGFRFDAYCSYMMENTFVVQPACWKKTRIVH